MNKWLSVEEGRVKFMYTTAKLKAHGQVGLEVSCASCQLVYLLAKIGNQINRCDSKKSPCVSCCKLVSIL